VFFEGSEKKAEVIVDVTALSLLDDINDMFWETLVSCCNAKILSKISNKHCKAFLLSESSLFVWHNRFIILTCGETQLVKSIEYFLQQTYAKHILHVTYQRKNEYFSHAQPSCFGDDIKLLDQYITGRAFRFGEMDSHHNYIFHQNNNYRIENSHKTYELLAYQISEQASKILTSTTITAIQIQQFLQLDSLLPDFQLDDFVFQPYGYSVNAIKQENYLTIHITPQAGSSYVSIESNLDLITLSPLFLDILKPQSFDLLSFNEQAFEQKVQQYLPKKYISKTLIHKTLMNNCSVYFANYILPQHHFTDAVELDLKNIHHTL
jgi:S-adenosylmethionine decarboxylase